MQIVDVDFRYVEREEKFSTSKGRVPEIWEATIKVLQWRKKIVTIEDRHGQETQWTGWKDVRTEDE